MKKSILFLMTACLLMPQMAEADDRRGDRGGRGGYDRNITPGQNHSQWNRGHGGKSYHYDRSHDHYRPLRPYAYQPYYYRPSQGVVVVNRPTYYERTVYVDRPAPVVYYDNGPSYYSSGPAYYVSDRYVIGSRVPSRGYWRDVPSWYAGRLPPPRHGERYVYADRDVLLVNAASQILSAFVLASAID